MVVCGGVCWNHTTELTGEDEEEEEEEENQWRLSADITAGQVGESEQHSQKHGILKVKGKTDSLLLPFLIGN